MLQKNNQKEGVVYLTKKERIMLNMLLRNGRTFNTSISKKLRISSQVTGRIRKKLEKIGIIKDYSVELDHYFLGIRVYVLALFDIEENYEEKLISNNLISFYKVITDSVTHIALYAFKSLRESDDYFNSLVEYSDHIKIIKTDIFPIEGLIKNSPKNLFYNAIKRFEKSSTSCMSAISSSYMIKREKVKSKELTISEKSVLTSLVKNSIMSCKKISSNLINAKLTRTNVNRIKNRLENKGIIRGYNVILDYEKLGVKVLAFVFLSQKSGILEQQEILIKRCHDSQNIIGCYRFGEETAMLCGFKDLNKLENYCDFLRSKYKDLIKIKHIHIISPRSVIKESFDDLYLGLLES